MKNEERNTASAGMDQVIDALFGVWLESIDYPSEARRGLDEQLEKMMETCGIPETKRHSAEMILEYVGAGYEKEAFWAGFQTAQQLYFGKR